MRAAQASTLTYLVAHTPYLAIARWCVSPYRSVSSHLIYHEFFERALKLGVRNSYVPREGS
jgi:hypothetical protein